MRTFVQILLIFLAILLCLGLAALGAVIGGALGGTSGASQSRVSHIAWQSIGAPPGGASDLLEVYASPYYSSEWLLYASAPDGRIYRNSQGTGWEEVAEVTPLDYSEDCQASVLTPPDPPEQPVETLFVSVCHAELIMQLGFARLADGSVWYWQDAYSGTGGMFEILGFLLGGGALGLLCGGLLGLLLLGLAIFAAVKIGQKA